MSKHPLIALGFVLFVGCAGEADATSAMRRAGYTDISVTDSHYVGVEWEGCSRGDNAAFDVTATAANKQRITAVVCCGAWKKCTIRF